MRFINKNLKAINTQQTAKRFASVKEMTAYVAENKIDDKQEFWFIVSGEQIIFSCVFEYFYEG